MGNQFDSENARLTTHILRLIEANGFLVAAWMLPDRREMRASRVDGDKEVFVVRIAHGEVVDSLYRAAVELAVMVGIDLE